MADKFIQFNDGSMNYKINPSQGEIKKSSLENDAKMQKLFDIFNKNKDSTINSEELNSLFNRVQEWYDADGNTIFSNQEAEQFLNNITTSDGKSLKESGISVSDLFGFFKKITEKELPPTFGPPRILSLKTPAVVKSLNPPSASDFEREEVFELSYNSIEDNYQKTSAYFENQRKSEGFVSNTANKVKELKKSTNARSVSEAALEREQVTLIVLSMAKEGTLTYKKYDEILNKYLIDHSPAYSPKLHDMYVNCYNKDTDKTFKSSLGIKQKGKLTEKQVQQAVIKQVVSNLTTEEKQNLISDMLSSDDATFTQKTQNILDEMISSGIKYNYTVTTTDILTIPDNNQTSQNGKQNSANPQKLHYGDGAGWQNTGTNTQGQQGQMKPHKEVSFNLTFTNSPKSANPNHSDKKRLTKYMTYEEAFGLERHVEYNAQNILDYEQKAAHMQIVTGIYNKLNKVNATIRKAETPLENARIHNPMDLSQALHQDRQIYTPEDSFNYEAGIHSALKEVFGKSKAKAGGGKLGINNLDPLNSTQIQNSQAAKAIKEHLNKEFKSVCGGKTMNQLEEELNDAYKKAYGNTDVNKIIDDYVKSQKEAINDVKMGVETTFMLTMIAGQLFPVSAPVATAMSTTGVIGSTIGPVGVSALENYTKPNGPTEEDKKEMLKELVQSGLLTASGIGIGKVAENIAGRVAMTVTKCPKFCAFVTEVGLDATMSLVADYAITGQIDLSGEGIAQLQQLIIGILHAKGVKSYFNKYKTKADFGPQNVSIRSAQDIPAPQSKNQGVSAGNETPKVINKNSKKGNTEKNPLLTKLETANDRESFVVIRDEIKKMPESEEKTQLMQAYLRKYNEWSSSPSRPDIIMQYIPKTNKTDKTPIPQSTSTDFDSLTGLLSSNGISGGVYTLPDGRKIIRVKSSISPLSKGYDYYEYDANGKQVAQKFDVDTNEAQSMYPGLDKLKPEKIRRSYGIGIAALPDEPYFVVRDRLKINYEQTTRYNKELLESINGKDAKLIFNPESDIKRVMKVVEKTNPASTDQIVDAAKELFSSPYILTNHVADIIEACCEGGQGNYTFNRKAFDKLKQLIPEYTSDPTRFSAKILNIAIQSRIYDPNVGYKFDDRSFEFAKIYSNANNTTGIDYGNFRDDTGSIDIQKYMSLGRHQISDGPNVNNALTKLISEMVQYPEIAKSNDTETLFEFYYSLKNMGINKESAPDLAHKLRHISDLSTLRKFESDYKQYKNQGYLNDEIEMIMDKTIGEYIVTPNGKVQKEALNLATRLKRMGVSYDINYILESCQGDYQKCQLLLDNIQKKLVQKGLILKNGSVRIDETKYNIDDTVELRKIFGSNEYEYLKHMSYRLEDLLNMYMADNGKYLDYFMNSNDIINDLRTAYGVRAATGNYGKYNLTDNSENIFAIMMQTIKNKPNEDQKYALELYKGAGYENMNNNPKCTYSQILASYLSKNELTQSVKVRRDEGGGVLCNLKFDDGTTLEEVMKNPQKYSDKFAQIETYFKGASFINDRFASTTVKEAGVTDIFSVTHVIWNLEVSKGVGAAYVDAIGFNSEGEILLNQGLKYTISDIKVCSGEDLVITAKVEKP